MSYNTRKETDYWFICLRQGRNAGSKTLSRYITEFQNTFLSCHVNKTILKKTQYVC